MLISIKLKFNPEILTSEETIYTRKRSSRMRTARLPTERASATRCQYPGGPQVNKFEQVSSDGHQISLAKKGLKLGVPCLMAREGGHMRISIHNVNRQTDRQTRVKTLPSRNFVGGR